MPEWAGWVLFIMIMYLIFLKGSKDYSDEIFRKLNELEEKLDELEAEL